MNLLQIKYFIEVCKMRNFTKAAKNLYVSQSSVSRQVQQLEEELGVELLKRETGRIELTPAGELFYQRFQVILGEISETIEQIKRMDEEERYINIGLFQPIQQDAITDIMEQIRQRFADVQIRIYRCKIMELQQLFQEGKLDLVLGIDNIKFDSGSGRKVVFGKKPIGILCSKQFDYAKEQLTLNDFQNKKLVSIDKKYAPGLLELQLEIMQKLGIEPAGIMFTGDVIAALTYSCPGDGFTIMPIDMVRAMPDDFQVLPLEDEMEFELCAYWKKKEFDFLISQNS